MNSIPAQAIPVAVATERLMLPIADATVHAGFPSPAEDFLVKRIDLNSVLVTHPQATFFLRVAGDSMRDCGIEDGDLLLVNRAIKPRHGQIVVAVVDGDFAVKQLHLRAGRLKLKAGNPTYPDITPSEGQTIEVWGVVTSCIKQFQT
ncbi:LexA family protein [Variovorax sp. AB1(2024)]|uniref:LexA family protein n=1 Tax=Variovorax sp. AB1(2024) TaxID=3132214 RepID=UPI003098CC62